MPNQEDPDGLERDQHMSEAHSRGPLNGIEPLYHRGKLVESFRLYGGGLGFEEAKTGG